MITMKRMQMLLAGLFVVALPVLCHALGNEDIVNISEGNFKAYLVENFDADGDGEVSRQEAETVTKIVCYKLEISSLEGIASFPALDTLLCWKNRLTTLDISQNTSLVCLVCMGNSMTNLNISHNVALTTLNCEYNELTSWILVVALP